MSIVNVIRELILVFLSTHIIHAAPTPQTSGVVEQVCTSTCSMTLSKSNKRKVVDSTATDVINSLSQYLRKLSVDITEDKIAVPDRPKISLSSEEITLEKNFKAGRNFLRNFLGLTG